MEIGCWKGKSAFCLARGLRRGRLTVIDPFDASGDSEAAGSYLANAGSEPLLQQFTSHMNRLGVIDKIDIWHGTSQDYVGLARSVELLFIDGDHSKEGCDFDFQNYGKCVTPGGFLAFHDYDPTRNNFGPTWVVEQKVLPNPEWAPFKRVDSLWVARRTQVS